jgi:hypothetical protein
MEMPVPTNFQGEFLIKSAETAPKCLITEGIHHVSRQPATIQIQGTIRSLRVVERVHTVVIPEIMIPPWKRPVPVGSVLRGRLAPSPHKKVMLIPPAHILEIGLEPAQTFRSEQVKGNMKKQVH